MHLCIQDIVADGDSIWFTVHDMAAILKYDVFGEYCEIEAVLPDNYLDEELVVGPIYKLKNMLIVAPIKGEHIYLYDIEKKYFVSKLINDAFKGLEMDSSYNANEYYGKTQGENCAIFLGKGYSNIAIFHNNKLEIYRYPDEVIRNIEGTYDGYFGSNAAIFSNKVYIPLCNTTKIFIFDLNSNCFVEEYDCGRELIACCSDKEGIWMIPQNKGELEYINLLNNKIYSVSNFPEAFCGAETRWFQSGQYCNGEIIVFPYKSNMLFRVNVNTHEMACIRSFGDYETVKYTHSGIFDEKSVWGFFYPESRLDIIDCRCWSIKSIFVDYPVNTLDVLNSKKGLLHNDRVTTEKIIQLNDFVRLLNSDIGSDGQEESVFTSIGKEIWNDMKEEE